MQSPSTSTPENGTPLVVGAGGVGLLLAHLLSSQGPPSPEVPAVRVLGRGETLERLRSEGFVAFDAGVHTHRPEAQDWEDWHRDPRVGPVLVAVKAGDLEAVLRSLALRPEGISCLYLLQNGLGILELARSLLPDVPTVRVSCYTGVAREGRNTIRVLGRGPFRIAAEGAGRSHLGWLPARLEPTGFTVQVVGSPHRMEWEKAMLNLVVNGICSVLAAPNGAVLESPELVELARELVRECVAVAASRGVRVKKDIEEAVLEAIARVAGNLNSTLQDLRAGQPTELDFLHHRVVAWAEEGGIPCPVTRTLLRLVRSHETSRRLAEPRVTA